MPRFRLHPLLVLAALAGIALTVALGRWQDDRGTAKKRLRTEVEAAAGAPAEPLADSASGLARQVLHKVAADGSWLATAVVYLDNRPNQGRTGVYVLMPLQLADGRVLVVNRGWLARGEAGRLAPYTTPAGAVHVEGIALADEARFLELGKPGPRQVRTIWQNFDYDAFASASGLVPLRLIVRDALGGADGLDRSWPDQAGALDAQIARHEGYEFQWYAMAATILFLTLFYGIRNGRRHAA